MTPIEIILGRHGYEILTGTVETDLTDMNIVGIIIRSPGATLAKLEVGVVNLLTTRTGLNEDLDAQDAPIMAGYDVETRSTKLFTNIQLTKSTDSVSLVYGKPNTGE